MSRGAAVQHEKRIRPPRPGRSAGGGHIPCSQPPPPKFSPQKAAEYFILAWVKNWSLKTYLSAVGAGVPYAELSAAFPWLPAEDRLGFSNWRVRTLAARYMRPISDALWDCRDDRARLALSARVRVWVSDADMMTCRERQDRIEAKQSKREYERKMFVHDMVRRDELDRGRRLWNKCK